VLTPAGPSSLDVTGPQLRAVGAAFLVRRPLIVGPLVALALVLLHLSGAPGRQTLALAVGSSVMLGFFLFEAVRFRRRPVTERHLLGSLLFTAAVLTVACVLTGALRSPFLPLLFAPTVTAFAAFGRSRESAATLGWLLLLLGALALLPALPFPPVASPWVEWMTLGAAVGSALLLNLGVSGLTGAYADTARQLTEARQEVLAAAETRARTLEALGAKVAHEIKNPLASVRALVELVAQGASEERARRRLGVVLGEVERIEGILRDYLGFSRPLVELRREEVDVSRLLADTAAVLEGRARAQAVALEVHREPLAASVDPRRLKEALFNLMANALEACAAGARVEARAEPREGGVLILVRDTGRGMSPETLARVGTPFFTTREQGTGLGVTLARAVATQHGGTLTFESEPGRGTVAMLWLPGAS
jgi:signal transduction histidine kinase